MPLTNAFSPSRIFTVAIVRTSLIGPLATQYVALFDSSYKSRLIALYVFDGPFVYTAIDGRYYITG